MHEIKIGGWIRVQSFKHNSTLHRTWDHAMVLDLTEDYIVVASKTNRVIESDGRIWYTKEPAVSIFFFKEWYNIIAMIRGNDVYYYCNIASPSLIDNSIIKYIDYDLDLKLLPDLSIFGLDEKEYEYHKRKYQYSPDLDKICKHAYKNVHRLMEKKIFPFDNEKILNYIEVFENLRKKQDIPHD